jgi:hypothetical protein
MQCAARALHSAVCAVVRVVSAYVEVGRGSHFSKDEFGDIHFGDFMHFDGQTPSVVPHANASALLVDVHLQSCAVAAHERSRAQILSTSPQEPVRTRECVLFMSFER